MSVSNIQGQLLEVTVTSCVKLKDTEWISRQDPYVCLEYGSTKYRTRTNTDGGTNPVFQEKFIFTLIEGLKELKVEVWNSNTIKQDDFIGDGMIHLQKVLSQGFDETSWPLHSRAGRHAGEVRLLMRYSQANKSETSCSPSAPASAYTTSYAHSPAFYQLPSSYPVYPPAPAAYPYHPTQLAAYPPPNAPPYHPTQLAVYRPPYAPPPSAYPYHPTQLPAYPPPYAPPPSPYPPPPYPYTDPSYYPTGPYRAPYPPPY